MQLRHIRRSMNPHTHLRAAPSARLQSAAILQKPISLRQPRKQILMNLAHHLRRPHPRRIPSRPALLQLRLGGHMRQRQPLPARLIGIARVIITQRLLNLQRQRVLPLQLVRVIRIHRQQQRAQPRQRPRLASPRQPVRGPNQIPGSLQKLPRARLGGQQGLHLHRMIIKREFLRH